MTHFDVWLRWYRANVNPAIDVEEARLAYDDYYACACISCTTRKATGHAPIRQGEGCTAPLTQLGEIGRVAS